MHCPHCGATLPLRPRARMILTGVLFCTAAFALLLFIHLGIVVLAAVLMLVVGVSSFKAAGKRQRCQRCRNLPTTNRV